jgi:phage terminase Nu1 subunit (DNA packaging protein)
MVSVEVKKVKLSEVKKNPDNGLSADRAGDEQLQNLLVVVDWLKSHGWKVSKSKVYADAKNGRIPSTSDGAYTVKAVEKYAGNYLRQKGSFSRRDESLSTIAEQKAEADKELTQTKAALAKLKLAAAEGNLVDKDYFDRELSRRAAIFRSDLEGMVRSKGADFSAVVSGEVGRIPDLIDAMLQELETVLSRYSEERPIEVPVTASDEVENDVIGDEDEEGDE